MKKIAGIKVKKIYSDYSKHVLEEYQYYIKDKKEIRHGYYKKFFPFFDDPKCRVQEKGKYIHGKLEGRFDIFEIGYDDKRKFLSFYIYKNGEKKYYETLDGTKAEWIGNYFHKYYNSTIIYLDNNKTYEGLVHEYGKFVDREGWIPITEEEWTKKKIEVLKKIIA